MNRNVAEDGKVVTDVLMGVSDERLDLWETMTANGGLPGAPVGETANGSAHR